MNNMKIIGFVGLPGSGKGEASQIARLHGLAVVVMGDVIRQEAARQGLEPTDQNLGRIGNALRAAEGLDAVAKKTFERALATGKDIVVVDGLRSHEEVDFFRSHGDEFYLIEVCAPAEARLKWLAARGRPDDPVKSSANDCQEKADYQEADADPRIISSCEEPDRLAAAALEQRECREMGWGMCEAIKVADLKLRNDGNLDEFRENVNRLLSLLVTGATSERKG
ncbi:MAG: AAA family ATPase [Methanothrix sp.]|nr:AAA family ATPase [Methanothrix sp.]MDD4446681.1 AAA family ATPase [Methanothrix sp.]